MRITIKILWLSLFLCFLSLQSFGQSSILQRGIKLSFNENTVSGHVENLLIQHNISLAFNSSRVDLSEVVTLPSREISVEELINALFYNNLIELIPQNNKILITFLDEEAPSFITIRGFVRDKQTGEVLVGASIVDRTSYASTFTSNQGFYSLRIPIDSNRVEFLYLGYKSQIVIDALDKEINVDLEFDNELTQVTITESISDNFLRGSGGEKIDLLLSDGFAALNGDNDVIKAVRINSGVQSGNEGQTGLYVRGGSKDQNLILFEGIPLYEVSHTAGLSSMFIEESIRNVDFIKNGFPARYGGRLSSVLNVQLKDGDQSGYHGSVNASLPSIKAHLEGPLFTENTTFNISGRLSYIDRYINQLVGNVLNYEVDLDFRDVVSKITHRFTNDRKVSFSFYNGGDNLVLLRERKETKMEDTFSTLSSNSLNWGNTVWNLNFSNIINDQLLMNMNFGGVAYRFTARSSYSSESIIAELKQEEFLDVISQSKIEDNLANIDFDYYLTDKHRFKFGAGWIHHQYNPVIRSSFMSDGAILDSLVSDEDRIIADELSVFLEDTYSPNEQWQLYGGAHISTFNIGQVSYRNFQPRLSMVYLPDSLNRITISYTRMNQYVHLLVNPGIGLPSNLWVPSTENIKPQSADQISISYYAKLSESVDFSMGGYYKYLNNVVDYSSPAYLSDILGGNDKPGVLDNTNWREEVNAGTSNSAGFEFAVHKTRGKLRGWFTYALSKTDRKFEDINGGQSFPFKYDRRHDFNIGLKYIFNPRFSISANWIYGTGNTFSLALEEFIGPFGIDSFITGGDRNNHRFPAYHHLDIQFNYEKTLAHGKLEFNLGLFNAYNRKNIYFIYIYDNPFSGTDDVRKTTLFPILPNLNIGYSF